MVNGFYKEYPELKLLEGEYDFDAIVGEREKTKLEKISKPRRKIYKLTDEDIYEKLIKSVDNTSMIHYTKKDLLDLSEGINDDEYIKNFKELGKAIKNYRKQIVFISILQGQNLDKIKSGKTINEFKEFLKRHDVSLSNAYFLIRFNKFIEEHPDLRYSNLPIRFFRINFGRITKIFNMQLKV